MTDKNEKMMREWFEFLCTTICDESCTEGIGGCIADCTYRIDACYDDTVTLEECVNDAYRWYTKNKKPLPPCICRWKTCANLMSFIKVNHEQINRFYNEYCEIDKEKDEQLKDVYLEVLQKKVVDYVIAKTN